MAIGVVFVALGAAGAFALIGQARAPDMAAQQPLKAVWTETQWPFPMDEWGKGKAFQCKAADCGAEVNLYIRAKIGFCNCATGVSDEEELDRLSDFRLMGDRISVVGPGRPIDVAWMKGRSRPYLIPSDRRSALAVAFNDRCDAIVATTLVGHDSPDAIEPSVIEFLNSEVIVHWAEVTLGL